MRYSAVALFAGAALATSTVYSTEEVTVLSCGPEVTNCPARSSTVPSYPVETLSSVEASSTPDVWASVSSSAPVSSESTPAPASSAPAVSTSTSVYVAPSSSAAPSVPVAVSFSSSSVAAVSVPSSSAAPTTLVSSAPQSVSVIPITYTTCVPTVSVSYSTVTVGATSSSVAAVGSSGLPGSFPVPTVAPTAGFTVQPTPSSSPIIPQGGAATLAGSGLLAAVAGAVAVLLA